MYPSTPKAAKLLGVTMYFNGRECKRGHVAPRYASTRQCSVCIAEHGVKWDENNRDRRREITRKWQVEKKDSFAASSKKYAENNREKLRKLSSAYASKHKPNRAESQRRRDAKKLSATPKWLSSEQLLQIKKIYAIAGNLTNLSGAPHHVDHIVPLRSKRVCGLHVPWNLQVLSASENSSKSNRVWPDM